MQINVLLVDADHFHFVNETEARKDGLVTDYVHTLAKHNEDGNRRQ